jgi:hypothetical protein
MRRPLTLALSILCGSALLSACGQTEQNLAVVANAPGTFVVGTEQRLLVSLVDPQTSEFLADPYRPATATLTAPEGNVIEVATDFLWTVPDVVGIYLIRQVFDQTGTWWVQLNPEGFGPTPKTSFVVANDESVPGIGDQAPSIATRTLADHTIEEISSDDTPDPSFYELSLDQALTAGQPLVVVFATPAFCDSQTCGPMLDQVKMTALGHPGANYIHIEVYTNLDAASTKDLQLDPAVTAWGLPSEPWVFVIDADGTVTARFEGAMLDSELEDALVALGA